MVHGGTLFKVHSDWCSDGKGTNQTALKLRQISNHTACVWAASLAAVHGRIKCQKIGSKSDDCQVTVRITKPSQQKVRTRAPVPLRFQRAGLIRSIKL